MNKTPLHNIDNLRDHAKYLADYYNETEIIVFRNELYLSKEPVMKSFDVTDRTIRTWVTKGILSKVSVGGRVYYRESEVSRLRQKQGKA